MDAIDGAWEAREARPATGNERGVMKRRHIAHLCGARGRASLALVLTVSGSTDVRAQMAVPDTARYRQEIAWLASPDLGGRAAGTAGSDSAAVYIGREFQALGLLPPFVLCGDAGCSRSHYQPFRFPGEDAARLSAFDSTLTQNVAGLAVGVDPVLRRQIIVVGAHYDHLGRSAAWARDWNNRGAIRPGADDNASGTVAILELARRFALNPPSRTILFVAFGAEEVGLVGSKVFLEASPVATDSILSMLNFDMVGRFRDKLEVSGTGTAPWWDEILTAADTVFGERMVRQPKSSLNSDNASFAVLGIPVLHFFTGKHGDYHTASDVADRINVAGLDDVIQLGEKVLRALTEGDLVGRPPRNGKQAVRPR